MTPQQIKDAAPEGATHYHERWSDLFYEYMYAYLKIDDGITCEREEGIWKETTMYDCCELKPL